MDPVLVCEGVTYVYADGTRANDSIDLSLQRGELFCLLGPNGAGKTTLIRQITTELVPRAGSVRLFGRDAHEAPVATRRRLGVIPQSAGLFEALSVDDHLRLFGPLKFLSRREPGRPAKPSWPNVSSAKSAAGGFASSPVVSGARCWWPWPCWPIRSCCSSTSPPSVSIPWPGARSGRRSRSSGRPARPSC